MGKYGLKPVPAHSGYYCTVEGRLFSDRGGRLHEVQGTLDKDGYVKVTLRVDGTREYWRLHRVILLTFVGSSVKQVNHKDGNKQNNRLDNLEYCTARENSCHNRLHDGCLIGVCWSSWHCKWRAYIRQGGRQKHLGYFEEYEDARQAYLHEAKRLNIKNRYDGTDRVNELKQAGA